MTKYVVNVCRIGYGSLDLDVEADNEDQAVDIALDNAGGESFAEDYSEYEAGYVEPLDKENKDAS